MKEFLGQNGNIFYLINQDYGEAMSFDLYGHKIEDITSVERAVANCLSIKPIDILSILGTSMPVVGKDYSEIYFKGERCSLNMSYLSVFAMIRSNIKSLGGRYYIRREEGYSQVILALEKDSITKGNIESLIGKKLSWSLLIN